jgi:hypothetical protein
VHFEFDCLGKRSNYSRLSWVANVLLLHLAAKADYGGLRAEPKLVLISASVISVTRQGTFIKQQKIHSTPITRQWLPRALFDTDAAV